MDKNQIIKLLLIDYKNQFKSYTSFLDRYHAKFSFIFLYMSAIVGVAAIFNYFGINSNSTSANLSEKFIVSIIFFLIFMLFLLITLLMDDLYHMYIFIIGMQNIEKQINKIIKIELLIWNSKILLPKVYSREKVGNKDWIKPNILIGVFSFFISLFLLIIFGYICYEFAKHYFYGYLIISPLILLFSCSSMVETPQCRN